MMIAPLTNINLVPGCVLVLSSRPDVSKSNNICAAYFVYAVITNQEKSYIAEARLIEICADQLTQPLMCEAGKFTSYSFYAPFLENGTYRRWGIVV